MPDSPDLFLNLTANDYWYFLTRIYDLEASQVEERLINLMATFDLTESRYNLISSLLSRYASEGCRYRCSSG